MSSTEFPASPAARDTKTFLARLSRGWRGTRPIILSMSVTLAAVGISSCADQTTAPSIAPLHPSIASERNAPKFWETGASVRWNGIARDLVATNLPKKGQQAALRAITYLSLAQYNAVVAAEKGKENDIHPSEQAAVAGASAAVLTYFFPSAATFIETQVADQKAAPQWPGEKHTDFDAGEQIGRGVGADVVAHAQTDRFNAVWTGTVPTGPGKWISSGPPVLPLLGQMRTFFMTSGSQFRPEPPPTFGSPEFLAALAEIRQISDTRTAEQISIARFWAMTSGSLVAGYWNEQASALIVDRHMSEREAAHAFALMNMAAMDAIIACHDAKYTYWLIRPTQADPGITLIQADGTGIAVGLPNHPSYPSNHACVSGTAAYILGHLFPSDKSHLASLAQEAAISRLYAGIHYRFDMDVGLEIARQVADLAIDLDVHGHQPFTLR
ncbi:MAG: vanadium-dependent haloperoxidase [Gemmatimonadota bacterium]|nr:vanadium-dependent haloperoxidase [Gemmatimonadota bacterium]